MTTRIRSRSAREIMNPHVEALSPATPITAAVATLMRRGYSGAPVVDDEGALVGVLTEQDCIRVLAESIYEDAPSGRVADHMTHGVESVGPGEDIFAVSTRLSTGGHRRVFVVEDGRLVGLISRRDLLRGLDAMRAEASPHERSDTYQLIQIRHQKYD